MASHLLFLGTYTRTTSKGIYAVRLDADTGALGEPLLVAETANPTWIELSPDKKFLYAIHASQAQAIGYAISGADSDADNQAPRLAPLPQPAAAAATPAAAPSHLAVDATGRTLLAANYHEDYVASLPIRSDGSLGEAAIVRHAGPPGPHPKRQTKPYPHSVTVSPDNRHVIVCDLGLDRIYSYALVTPKPGEGGLDPAAATLAPATPPFVATDPGAGPRHFKFDTAGRHAYVINELGNTVTAYDYAAASGTLTPIQTVPTLPADFAGANTTAEVRLHPNGKFLYGSNRGHDSLAVYSIDPASGRLSFVDRTPSGGKTPRNFALSPDGRWLVCAHQDTEVLTVFRVDPLTGRLAPTPHTAKVPMCVCVVFYR